MFPALRQEELPHHRLLDPRRSSSWLRLSPSLAVCVEKSHLGSRALWWSVEQRKEERLSTQVDWKDCLELLVYGSACCQLTSSVG